MFRSHHDAHAATTRGKSAGAGHETESPSGIAIQILQVRRCPHSGITLTTYNKQQPTKGQKDSEATPG